MMKIPGVAEPAPAHTQRQPAPGAIPQAVAGQPAVAVVVPTPANQPAKTQSCDCSVPEGAGSEIKTTRILSIVMIIVHAIALLVFGFYIWAQWVASLCGIIAGSILLCCYQKPVYTCVAITYIFAAVFDLVAAIIWLYYGVWPIIFPLAGLGVAIPGIICGFKACAGWDEISGEKPFQGPVANVGQPAQPAAGNVVHQMPQQQYAHAAYPGAQV